MTRRAFTLIELIISVVLLFLIVFFLVNNYQTLKNAAALSTKHETQEAFMEDFVNLISKDLLQAKSIAVKSGKNTDIVYIEETTNSLYGKSRTNVSYAVLREANELIRIESIAPITLPQPSASASYAHDFLVIDRKFTTFKVYKGRGDNNTSSGCTVLIGFQIEGNDPFLIELGLLNSSAC